MPTPLVTKPNEIIYPKTADVIASQGEVTSAERARLLVSIKRLLAAQKAVLIAHYYTHEDVQLLADDTGGIVSDSLEMARYGADHPAEKLIIAGVRFMGETAKILSPEKQVFMPTLEAECSLDLACPADEFAEYCDRHPDREVVVYANTSAAVKARADWIVTSSVGLKIVEYLHAQGKKILWAPDKHLGHYIQQKTGADMLLWDAACIVHDEFKARELRHLKAMHPDAAVLAHPESPADVIGMADMVGSTTQLINAGKTLQNKQFIVATDKGIFHKMQLAAPDKEFIEAPTGGKGASCSSCAHCPWMAMNDLQALEQVLIIGNNEIHIDESIRVDAVKSLQRMLDFAKEHGTPVLGYGNA